VCGLIAAPDVICRETSGKLYRRKACARVFGGTRWLVCINPAAYTHTSVAIADALSAIEKPVIEVHISNIHKREKFRHHSYVSAIAEAVICGCGTSGYVLALERMAEILKKR